MGGLVSGNLEKGLDRASAAVILNSAATGRPEAIIEASTINAKRTAASAALAAKSLISAPAVSGVTLIGCGLINFEIARFLRAVFGDLTRFCIFDLDSARAAQFKTKCLSAFEGITVDIAPTINAALEAFPLISFATTAIKPHVSDLSMCQKSAVILHIAARHNGRAYTDAGQCRGRYRPRLPRADVASPGGTDSREP
jgi:ornithine cyclodeaminase/alanine dehydrogenase-like protein (mu-crystallin family)